MKPPRLVRKEFKSWLESKKPRQVVGYRGDNSCCPLSTFLVEVKNVEAPDVTETTYGLWAGFIRVARDIPKWGGDFVLAIDEQPKECITAATALRVLEKIR